MTIDEAIKHAEEVAGEHERRLKVYENLDEDRPLFKEEENACKKCAEEHRQLVEWLRELKKDREILTELDTMIDCYENCESCQGFREYPTSQFVKDVIQINKKVNADE